MRYGEDGRGGDGTEPEDEASHDEGRTRNAHGGAAYPGTPGELRSGGSKHGG